MQTHTGVVHLDLIDHNGHLNAMCYLKMFDDASHRFYDIAGVGDCYRSRTGCALFTVDRRIAYLAELRVNDTFAVKSRVLGFDDKRLLLLHEMLRTRDERLSAVHESTFLHVNQITRKATNFPPEVTEKLELILAEHSGEPLPSMVGQPPRVPNGPHRVSDPAYSQIGDAWWWQCGI